MGRSECFQETGVSASVSRIAIKIDFISVPKYSSTELELEWGKKMTRFPSIVSTFDQ